MTLPQVRIYSEVDVHAYPSNLGSLLSPTLGIPPFALRPSLSHSSQSQPARPPIEVPAHSLSPLYSSSSSSDAPEDSFLHLDTLDPFSRFWGALENMLGDISKPVAFASAPLTVGMPAVDELVRRARKGNRGKRKEVVAEGKGKGEVPRLRLSPR